MKEYIPHFGHIGFSQQCKRCNEPILKNRQSKRIYCQGCEGIMRVEEAEKQKGKSE